MNTSREQKNHPKKGAFYEKTLVLAATFVFALSSIAFAVPQENTGCGLGNMVFAGEDGLASQVCAITTNGLASNTGLCHIGHLGLRQTGPFLVSKSNHFCGRKYG